MLEAFSTWPVVWQAFAATVFTWGLTAIDGLHDVLALAAAGAVLGAFL